jgi:hypothetical protein
MILKSSLKWSGNIRARIGASSRQVSRCKSGQLARGKIRATSKVKIDIKTAGKKYEKKK